MAGGVRTSTSRCSSAGGDRSGDGGRAGSGSRSGAAEPPAAAAGSQSVRRHLAAPVGRPLRAPACISLQAATGEGGQRLQCLRGHRMCGGARPRRVDLSGHRSPTRRAADRAAADAVAAAAAAARAADCRHLPLWASLRHHAAIRPLAAPHQPDLPPIITRHGVRQGTAHGRRAAQRPGSRCRSASVRAGRRRPAACALLRLLPCSACATTCAEIPLLSARAGAKHRPLGGTPIPSPPECAGCSCAAVRCLVGALRPLSRWPRRRRIRPRRSTALPTAAHLSVSLPPRVHPTPPSLRPA